MHKIFKTYFSGLILLILAQGTVYSQITTSPYSIFGLGFLEGSSSGPSRAMGGTSLAFLSKRSINYANPASYGGIDSLVSIFELGFFSKYTIYSTHLDNQSLLNANIRYLAMGFRITPWLATSFGFSPYSSVGYTINTTAPVEGTTLVYPKTFSGDGGVNRVFLGGSVNLIKNLSVGINAAYLFGNVTHTESSSVFDYVLQDATYVSNLTFNYGLNYQLDIKKWKYNIGLTYASSKKLNTRNVTTIQTAYQTEVLKSRQYKFSIPQSIGAGFAMNKGYFKAGVDYEWSNWEQVDFTNTYLSTRNSNRYSLGVEFPSLGLKKGSGKMIFYRFGGEYRESYMIIKGIPINYRAVTFGVGLPLKGVVSVINLSLELGQNGTKNRDLFKESFVTLNLDLSLRDLWFMKQLYY
ncbi:MAG: hypothetical protein E4H43_00950 [Bacteroidia bacterium]|nr:MAG: hypothetical protein E4H43_00950 [Bacteroidia bacterium]